MKYPSLNQRILEERLDVDTVRTLADFIRELIAENNGEPIPEHADEVAPRYIGYTRFECERDMRRMTNGERGCANPDEHAS